MSLYDIIELELLNFMPILFWCGRKGRPQLTTSLRAFAGVSKEWSADCSELDGTLLLKKRHQQMVLTGKQNSWSGLCQEILLQCSAENRKKVANHNSLLGHVITM